MIHPALATDFMNILGVVAIFSLIFILAEFWKYIANPHPEWTRKFVHLSCGIVISFFPWLFTSPWSVLILFFLFGAVMAISRYFKLFPSIYGIKRSSLGDIYYLIAALMLFFIAHDQPVLYFISMLTLTISDALAAVLGNTYQKNTYTVENHSKSLEGSAVFFFSTFLIVHIPLLLMLKIDPLHSLLVAIQVALVVTCLEAVCINGFDNVIIPLATYFLIFKLLPAHSENITIQILLQLMLFVLTYFISVRFKFLSVSGALVGQLFMIAAFSLGGPNWLILPLISLGVFTVVWFFLKKDVADLTSNPKVYQVIATFHIAFVPTLIILADNASKTLLHVKFIELNCNFFYVLFVGAIASQLVIAVYRLFWLYYKQIKLNYLFIVSIAMFCYMGLIPLSLWEHICRIQATDMFIVGIIMGTSSALFYYLFKKYPIFQLFPWEFRVQSLSVFCGVILSLPIHFWLQPK